MNAPTYQLSRRFWLLGDVDEPIEREHLKAHVRSGDYFGMLASDLDEISQLISDSNVDQSIMLQQIINNLLFIERNYKLIPK